MKNEPDYETLYLKAEESLRASVQRFLSFVASAPVGIFHSDLNGTTIYVNDAWCAITGMSTAEALEGDCVSAIHPNDREFTLKSRLEFLRGEAAYQREERYQWKDGTIRYGYVQMTAERLESGEIILLISVSFHGNTGKV